jgi:hypothetical protein
MRIRSGKLRRGTVFPIKQPFWDIGTPEELEEFRGRMK